MDREVCSGFEIRGLVACKYLYAAPHASLSLQLLTVQCVAWIYKGLREKQKQFRSRVDMCLRKYVFMAVALYLATCFNCVCY